jgi:muramoyltetrapeptide carboxypeptidase
MRALLKDRGAFLFISLRLEMVVPDLLQPGDKVAIVAPARKLNAADVDFAARLITSWGLEVVIGKNIYSSLHSYFSGSDRERLEDLQVMINDPTIRGVFCARGGYGSTRILDALDLSALFKNPKWIVGFSDITSLHLKLFKTGFASVHATMPVLFSKEDSARSVESLRQLLMYGECEIETPASDLNRQGRCSGQIIGGNLSLLADSIGTPTEPDTREKILLIEEVDEYRYKVDRMMTQLRRSGKLENLAGLVVGHMTDIKDTELSFGTTIQEIILDAVSSFNYPVAFNFPSGHENPNLAWIHGGDSVLTVSPAGVSFKFTDLQNIGKGSKPREGLK